MVSWCEGWLTLGRGQVHADATDFGGGLSKEDVYKMLLLQAKGLLDGQRNWVGLVTC